MVMLWRVWQLIRILAGLLNVGPEDKDKAKALVQDLLVKLAEVAAKSASDLDDKVIQAADTLVQRQWDTIWQVLQVLLATRGVPSSVIDGSWPLVRHVGVKDCSFEECCNWPAEKLCDVLRELAECDCWGYFADGSV